LFSLLFTGLLAWDRHVSHFEPSYVATVREPVAAPQTNQSTNRAAQSRSTADPRSRGAGVASAEGLTQPPSQPSELKGPKELPLFGEAAIDGWIADHARRSSANYESGNCEVTDLAVLEIDAIHSWKFGEGLMDEKEGSIFTWFYRGWGILHNLPMSEVY